MQILYLHTYDYSFEIWQKSGNVSREAIYFKELQKQVNSEIIILSYSDKNQTHFENLIQNIEIIPVYKYIKYSSNRYIRFLKSFFIPFKVKKLLKNKEIDLIIQNQLLGSWVSIVIKYLLKSKLMIRTGYDAYTFKINESKKPHIIIFYKLLTLISLMICDIYSVTTESDKKFLTKKFKKFKNKIKVRPNFVYKNSNPIFENKNNKILSVGRLESQKNLSYLIKEFSNTEIIIDHYGEGSELEYLQNLAKIEKVNISFNNNIENSKLIKLMDEYKYFISCSKYEGNPKVILEALISGCIVFAPDSKNLREIIVNEYNGFLYDLEKGVLIKLFEKTQSNTSLHKEIFENSIKSINQNTAERLVNNQINDFYSL